MELINSVSDVLFSGQAPDAGLSAHDDGLTSVTFSLKQSDGSTTEFSLVCDSQGEVTVRLRDILEAVVPALDFTQVMAGASQVIPLPGVVLQALDADGSVGLSLPMRVIKGGRFTDMSGSLELDDAFPSVWLTFKPRVTRTWEWSREILSFFAKLTGVGVTAPDSEVAVTATVHLALHPDVMVTLFTGTLPDAANAGAGIPEDVIDYVVAADCSLQNVRLKLAALGDEYASDTVLAYDVTATMRYDNDDIPVAGREMTAAVPHRFIVARDSSDVREFLFRNSLGVIDTIYSRGGCTERLEHDSSSAIVGHLERETGNESAVSFEVHSGYIASARERGQWREFLSSDERYVIERGYVWDPRRIIVDDASAETAGGETGDVSFTFHYADRRESRAFDTETLEDYAYDKPEL